jgi:hypothetical protein
MLWPENTKWMNFVQRCKDNGVEMRPLVSGKTNKKMKYDDFATFSLHKQDARLSTFTIAVVNYDNDGFGLWLEAPASHTKTLQLIVDGKVSLDV